MQRAALAKLLLTNPSALFLDEPTKGMDAAFKAEFGSLLKNLCARGATVLIATHDLDFAAEFSDRCGMLFDGKILSFLPAKAFFAQNKFYTTAFCRIAASLGLDSLTMKEFIVRLKAQQSSERKKEDPEV